VQVGTVQLLGHFLTEDPLDVPWSVVEYVAGQVEIADASVVKRYTKRQQTAYEQTWGDPPRVRAGAPEALQLPG
jgi:hypothetical protein